jgi:hypothetical protein
MEIRKQEFINSIFSLNTRKFGTVAEVLLEKVLINLGYKVKKSESLSYDKNIDGLDDEIKASRVLVKNKLDLLNGNIVENLIKQDKERRIKKIHCCNYDWDCNIQQIKTKCFENLWYCLFFEDTVEIFKINKTKILSDSMISYSNKQHRGNEGEGQFHVTNKNVKYHLGNYHFKTITYDEIIKILNK